MTIVIAVVFPPLMFAPCALSPLAAAIALQLLIRFVVFMPPVTRLRAVVAEVLDRFMQAPIAARSAPVAIVPIIRLHAGRAGKKQKSTQHGGRQRGLAENRFLQMLMQLHNILPRTSPGLVRGCRPVPTRQTRRRRKCCERFMEGERVFAGKKAGIKKEGAQCHSAAPG